MRKEYIGRDVTGTTKKALSLPMKAYKVRLKHPLKKKCETCGGTLVYSGREIEGIPVYSHKSERDSKRCTRLFVAQKRAEATERLFKALPKFYIGTGKTANRVSTRNRRIITILNLEGRTSSKALAKRLGLPEKTILVELRYLREKKFVREVE